MGFAESFDEWVAQRRREGKVPITTWIVVAAIAALTVWWIWTVVQPERDDFLGSIVIYTTLEEECFDYLGRSVAIESGEGELLWRGETDGINTSIRIPALGCEVSFRAEGMKVSDAYKVSIERMGTHTYKHEVIEDDFVEFQWDSICLEDREPCQDDEPNYET